MVKVFTRKGCAYCPMVKRLLEYRHIPFEEIDIDEKPDLFPKDYTTVPLTQVGDRIIVGYNCPAILQALRT